MAKNGLYYKHTELAMLDWPLSEFNKLVANGDIRRPEAYKLVLKVCGFSVKRGVVKPMAVKPSVRLLHLDSEKII